MVLAELFDFTFSELCDSTQEDQQKQLSVFYCNSFKVALFPPQHRDVRPGSPENHESVRRFKTSWRSRRNEATLIKSCNEIIGVTNLLDWLKDKYCLRHGVSFKKKSIFTFKVSQASPVWTRCAWTARRQSLGRCRSSGCTRPGAPPFDLSPPPSLCWAFPPS